MKKIYLLVALFLSIFSYSQNFDSFASGVKINSTVYNVTSSAPIQQINPAPDAQNFDGSNLGTFGQNSSCAKITGGEIKTWKTASGNVCGTTLNWRVYPASASPSGSFNSVPLTTISECDLSTNAFYDGFGPCSNNDQKWKDYSINIDFVNSLTTGNYILEIYYTLTGSDVNASTCETIKYINNSGLNYKASFTVSNPITDPTVSSTSVCEGESLTLIANPSGGVSPYTFSWTGPNGFTSTDENPIINNISLSNAGAYSLIVTDACGSFSNSKSTAAVVVNAKIDPEFDATLPAICKNGIAPLLSTTSTNGITGSWNPPIVSNTATATYVFTPDPGQCANSLSFTVFVVNNVSPAFTLPTSICFGATPPVLNNISNNGIVGTWSPATVSNTSSGTYTFTPSSLQCALPVTVQINVNPLFAVFTPAIPPICSGEVLNDLPTTSTNGVTGTWSPAINNTATTTYTFTPTAGQCTVTPVTMTIVVNPIAATFTSVAPICSGDALTPLPTTSDNGVTGTWSPATNNTTTTTYTFAPTAGQCAVTPATMTIVVNQNVTPTFTAIDPICSGSASPVLPTTSNNSIIGTWNPATVSNTASATYTFTPTAGQCALPTTLDVTINPKIIPLFDPIADVCYGAAAPSLPTTSNNGITGIWNPATVSNTASGTYTFTPSTGICATTATLTINVNTIIPSFNTVAPICANATAPILATTSTNGITGTWNPTTVSNTASGTYTFTPDDGQCATTATLDVTVNPILTPSFTAIAPICSGATSPVLPLTSNNGITGTWNPATVSNTSSETYTFTPNVGECATETTLNVTVNPIVTPTFTAIAPICSGSTRPVLSTTSNNSITGTWNPATVSNTASGTYTFTPTAGQCSLATSLDIVVYQSPTDIVFSSTDVVNGNPDGIIEITGVTSGVAPFQYRINNGSFTSNTTYANLLPGDYTITVRDSNGCEFNKTAKINSLCVFPNAITPNNDTYNDTFNLKGCNVVRLELYNRYGVKVNRYNNYSDQWDGTNDNGKSLPDGTYFYVAEKSDGTSKSGWVFVTR